MIYCNMCVVLLSKKRDFVREMEKYGNVQRYDNKMNEVSEKGGERGMDSVWLGPLYIESSK